MFEMISKEDYLEQRRVWKEEYMALSTDIKALKQAQTVMASGAYSASVQFQILSEKVREGMKKNAARVQSLRANMSNNAASMMDELEMLKYNSRMTVAFERWVEQQNNGV